MAGGMPKWPFRVTRKPRASSPPSSTSQKSLRSVALDVLCAVLHYTGLLSLGLKVRRLLGGGKTRVLCYHRVADDEWPDTLKRDRFLAHLVHLRRHYHLIDAGRIVECLSAGRPLPRDSVASRPPASSCAGGPRLRDAPGCGAPGGVPAGSVPFSRRARSPFRDGAYGAVVLRSGCSSTCPSPSLLGRDLPRPAPRRLVPHDRAASRRALPESAEPRQPRRGRRPPPGSFRPQGWSPAPRAGRRGLGGPLGVRRLEYTPLSPQVLPWPLDRLLRGLALALARRAGPGVGDSRAVHDGQALTDDGPRSAPDARVRGGSPCAG